MNEMAQTFIFDVLDKLKTFGIEVSGVDVINKSNIHLFNFSLKGGFDEKPVPYKFQNRQYYKHQFELYNLKDDRSMSWLFELKRLEDFEVFEVFEVLHPKLFRDEMITFKDTYYGKTVEGREESLSRLVYGLKEVHE